MANSLFSEGEISLRRADYPPIAKRLVPQMADKPKLLAGLEEQGYVMVNAVDDLYVGYDGNQSGFPDAVGVDPAISQIIEFRSEDYGDACIDLSRSFVSATVQCEYLAGEQTVPVAWSGASRDYPMSLRNGAGQLLFSRCETEINNVRVEDDADATEDGPALSGWVQVITQEKATFARGGPSRVWAVPGPQAGANPGPADPVQQEGFYFVGSTPGGGGLDLGVPRAISASVGHPTANEEAWSLCDDWNIAEGTDVVPPRQSTFGENTQYPFGQSRGGGAAALTSSFDSAGNSRATIRFRPASSIWRQPVCLPAGCRVNLRLYKSQIQRWLQSQYYSQNPVGGGGNVGTDGHIWATRAYWERVSLWLWIVRPREMILRDIRHSLATEKFLIPLTARRVFAAQPDDGQTGFVASGLFPGVQPARVWCWLTRAHQQTGMSAQDLARFSPYGMSPYGCHEPVEINGAPAANTFPSLGTNDKIPIIDYAAITTPDGRQYPQNGYNNPLVIEETERRYATYLAACDEAQAPVLSFRAYSANYPILCFDINQQTAGMASSDADNVLGVPLPYNNEGLTLRLQFHTAVDNAAEAGDSLPGLWVVAVAESVGGLLFYGGPHGLHGGAVRVKKIGY